MSAAVPEKMSKQEMQDHYDHTMDIIYENLLKVLEERP